MVGLLNAISGITVSVYLKVKNLYENSIKWDLVGSLPVVKSLFFIYIQSRVTGNGSINGFSILWMIPDRLPYFSQYIRIL